MRQIDVYAHWTWDCPICDASNYVASKDKKIVCCCRCKREFEIRDFIGEVFR